MKLQQPYYIEKRTLIENHLDLNGKWSFCYTDKPTDSPLELSFSYECEIPSATYFNVYEAGILPHPYEGCNSREYRFVDQKVWYYKREFSLEEYTSLGKAFLCFDGMGYFSRVFINGQLIGEHEGLFGGPIVDVNDYLRFGEKNELIVEITSCNYGIPDEEWANIYTSPYNKFLVPWNMIKDSHTSNGDFSTMGIYRDVRLELVPPIHISRPYLTTENIEENFAELHLSVEIVPEDVNELSVPRNDINGGSGYTYGYSDGINIVPTDVTVEMCFELKEKQSGKTVYSSTDSHTIYDSDKVGINPKYKECQFFEKDIRVDNPKLWYPVGLGEPQLYTAEITIYHNGKKLDFLTFDYGIRTFKLERTSGARMRQRWGDFKPVINGKSFFLKGMNWTPIDQLLNIKEEDFRWALELALKENIQLIRVWGAGNAPEHDIFYSLCDEYGILVWQDSFISNNCNPGWDRELFQNQQAMYLYRLRNHPSLVIHCSGNENSPYDKRNSCVWVWQYETEDIDPTRERIRTTPDKGIAHIYHGFEPCWFRKMYKNLPFVGESGTHSFPNAKTFRKLLGRDEFEKNIEQFGEAKVIETHPGLTNHITENDAWGMLKKVPALSHIGSMKNISISELCDISGIASFEYYQFMIQSMREQYPVTGGVMPWVFKRPWATVATQVVDGLGDPIAPYYAVKNAYKQLEIHLALTELSYTVGETVKLDARIINESGKEHNAVAKIQVYSPNLECVFEKVHNICIEDKYQTYLPVEEFIIPEEYNDKFFFLRVALYENGDMVSQSFYWPVVLNALKDEELLTDRRSKMHNTLTHENGPWLKPQLQTIKDYGSITVSVSDISRENDRIFGDILLENTSDIPLFPLHICCENDECVQCLEDDWFFLPQNEKRKIAFTLRNDKQFKGELEFIVSAWNMKPMKIIFS